MEWVSRLQILVDINLITVCLNKQKTFIWNLTHGYSKCLDDTVQQQQHDTLLVTDKYNAYERCDQFTLSNIILQGNENNTQL